MKCESCRERAFAWLVQYWEGFCGPRAGWTDETQEKLMCDFGLLIAFTSDFRASNPSPEESK